LQLAMVALPFLRPISSSLGNQSDCRVLVGQI